jgi:hypothetical protein
VKVGNPVATVIRLIDHDNRVVQFLRLIAVTNAVIALTIPVTTLISSIDPTDGN